MKKEVFADTIGQVHYAAGMARFDLATMQPTEEGKEVVPESNLRLIMPLKGFLSTLAAMQQLADKLEAAGIIEKKDK